MAEYKDHYSEIQSTGASVAAVSVDAPETSQAVRAELFLPFPILCDTERRVVKDWGIYHSVKGGIAKPAVFMIDADRVIRFASVDTVANRVPAAEILSLLQNTANARPVRRRVHMPLFSDWLSAIRSHFRG